MDPSDPDECVVAATAAGWDRNAPGVASHAVPIEVGSDTGYCAICKNTIYQGRPDLLYYDMHSVATACNQDGTQTKQYVCKVPTSFIINNQNGCEAAGYADPLNSNECVMAATAAGWDRNAPGVASHAVPIEVPSDTGYCAICKNTIYQGRPDLLYYNMYGVATACNQDGTQTKQYVCFQA